MYQQKQNQHSSVGRASALSHAVRQWWHDRSWFWAPVMPASRYVLQNGSAAMLATKRLAGIALEVNLREHVTHTPAPNMNKVFCSGFKTQRRCHQKSKTGLSVAPLKGLMSFKYFFEEKYQQKKIYIIVQACIPVGCVPPTSVVTTRC